MALLPTQLLHDSLAALGHLSATELTLATVALAVDVAALALLGSAWLRSREVVAAAAELDEAA